MFLLLLSIQSVLATCFNCIEHLSFNYMFSMFFQGRDIPIVHRVIEVRITDASYFFSCLTYSKMKGERNLRNYWLSTVEI